METNQNAYHKRTSIKNLEMIYALQFFYSYTPVKSNIPIMTLKVLI